MTLIEHVELVRKVALFERGAEALEELQCLALVSEELLTGLRVAMGFGPFDEWSFDDQLDWMTGPTNQPCADSCRKAISVAAASVARLQAIWLKECPYLDQGLVRPLVTSSGRIVLMCDRGGEVWLHPDDLEQGKYHVPAAPDWEPVAGVRVAPGTTHWASADDVEALDWPVNWRD